MLHKALMCVCVVAVAALSACGSDAEPAATDAPEPATSDTTAEPAPTDVVDTTASTQPVSSTVDTEPVEPTAPTDPAPTAPASTDPAPTDPAPTDPVSTDAAGADAPTAEEIEVAFQTISTCVVNDEFGRGTTQADFFLDVLTVAQEAPADPLDDSFLCSDDPPGDTPRHLALSYDSPAEATAVAEWLAGATPCFPAGVTDSWVLVYAAPSDTPITDFEGIVAMLRGEMITTCV